MSGFIAEHKSTEDGLIYNKTCAKCKIKKPETEFYLRKSRGKWTRYSYCKQCNSQIQSEWRSSHPEYKKKKLIWERDWDRRNKDRLATRPRPMLCEICNSPGNYLGIVFDHDHSTGLFRGWLCSPCNAALGRHKDNPLMFERMAKYIRNKGIL